MSESCSTPRVSHVGLVIEIRLNLLLLIITAISTCAESSFSQTWFRSYSSWIITTSSTNSCLTEWAILYVFRNLFWVRWKSRLLKYLTFIVLLLQLASMVSSNSLDFWCVCTYNWTIFFTNTATYRPFAFVINWTISMWNTRTTFAHTERIYHNILRLVECFLICTRS